MEKNSLNWTGKVCHYFIYNEKLTFSILIILFIWGIFSFFLTPKQYNPTIVAPAFKISVDFPGATRNEVINQVTKPLENVLRDIPGVEDIYSVSMHGGKSIVNVNFYVGEDFNKAKVAVRNRLKTDMNLAPLGIIGPEIETIDPEEVPIVTLSLTSKKIEAVGLRKFAFKLRDRLTRIDGASKISVIGGRKKELLIKVNEDLMEKYAISFDHIEKALKLNNIFLPSGVIKGQEEYSKIEADGRVHSADDVKDIIVVSTPTVKIRLGQIAHISDEVEEIENHVRHVYKKNGKITRENAPVLISISKIKGTNVISITEEIKKTIYSLQQDFIPKDIVVNTLIKDGDTAKEEIDGLMKNLLMAITIVVAILFLFLSFRASILVAIAIPLTLANVFGVALMANQNINRITLFALILSLGLLVDNATVVIENIVRHIKKSNGESTKDIAIQSVNEVGKGLFMSTVTTVLAFIPMAYVTGMMGPYMGPIPFFVPTALIISLIVSFSINPWLASRLLSTSHFKVSPKKEVRSPKISELFMEKYKNFLVNILKNKKRASVVVLCVMIILIISCALPFIEFVKFRMLPKADVEQFYVYIDLPEGSSLEKTLAVTTTIEEHIIEKSNVTMVQSYIGTPPITDFNGLFKGVRNRRFFHQSTIRVGLTDDDIRKIKSEEIAANMRKSLRKKIIEENYPFEVRLKIIEDPPGPPVLSTFLARVQSFDESLSKKITTEIFSKVNKIKGLVDRDTSMESHTKTIQLRINHLAANQNMISPAQIVQRLNTMYSGKIIGFYHSEDNIEQEYIRLRYDKRLRFSKEVLSRVKLRNPLRNSVPLTKLVEFVEVDTPDFQQRENRMNTIYITGEMENRSVTYAAIDLLKELWDYKPLNSGTRIGFNLFGAEYKMPDGKKVFINLGGEWELTLEVFRDLILAMIVSIFIIYFVLLAQFKSFLDPFIIMSSIPLSIIGVFPGFTFLYWFQQEYFTATSMIGVIALAGIAVNNSIILLEYLNHLKDRGMELKEALIKACLTRFRPIMLTTLTTMLGSLTIADDPVWAGLAYAIVFGLVMSSCLILIVFPTSYFILHNK